MLYYEIHGDTDGNIPLLTMYTLHTFVTKYKNDNAIHSHCLIVWVVHLVAIVRVFRYVQTHRGGNNKIKSVIKHFKHIPEFQKKHLPITYKGVLRYLKQQSTWKKIHWY